MKFNLNEYEEGRRYDVSGKYAPDKLELEYVDLKYRSPVEMTGWVEKGPDSLMFRGDLVSSITRVCGRCLKEVQEDTRIPFEFFYETGDLEEIDSTDDLRESIMLEHPLNFVCGPNCKGLCPACGVDLNKESCSCGEKEKNQPFSQLKDFKMKYKEEK